MPPYCEIHQRYHVPLDDKRPMSGTVCPICVKEQASLTPHRASAQDNT